MDLPLGHRFLLFDYNPYKPLEDYEITMSMYGEPEYGDTNEDPFHPKVRMPASAQPQKAQPQVGEGGHVDSNPSPAMGSVGDTLDEVPFLANPRRAMPAQAGVAMQIDYNPSPNVMGDRNYQSAILDDDPGIAKENDPRYRLVKPEPGAPNAPNQLLDYYINSAIDAIGNSNKVVAGQMIGAAKTLVTMVKVNAEKTNNAVMLQKLETYGATIAQIEKTINS